MSATGGDRQASRVKESQVEVVIDADKGDVTITLDRTHSLLAAVRACRVVHLSRAAKAASAAAASASLSKFSIHCCSPVVVPKNWFPRIL